MLEFIILKLYLKAAYALRFVLNAWLYQTRLQNIPLNLNSVLVIMHHNKWFQRKRIKQKSIDCQSIASSKDRWYRDMVVYFLLTRISLWTNSQDVLALAWRHPNGMKTAWFRLDSIPSLDQPSVLPATEGKAEGVSRRSSYLGLTRSKSWLPMPWLLASPRHQRPWYWLC